MGVESHFPEVIESTAGADTAQSQDIFCSGKAPEHTRAFAAGADDRLTAGFDDPRTHEETPTAESAILHARHVANEVPQFLFHRLSSSGSGAFLARGCDELLDFVAE